MTHISLLGIVLQCSKPIGLHFCESHLMPNKIRFKYLFLKIISNEPNKIFIIICVCPTFSHFEGNYHKYFMRDCWIISDFLACFLSLLCWMVSKLCCFLKPVKNMLEKKQGFYNQIKNCHVKCLLSSYWHLLVLSASGSRVVSKGHPMWKSAKWKNV